MFEKLFAERGLSLDRLRSLLEVASAGSIVKAADGDPVRQSQYSRQIKELEDFFRVKLVERHGKGVRLTQNGKELARISRFFMLGLSNFQRGSLAEAQTFRIGASATFIQTFLLPMLAARDTRKAEPAYATEVVTDDEIERRLHDLTLDFGIVTTSAISRPLQLTRLGGHGLSIWVPKKLYRHEKQAMEAMKQRRLTMILPKAELPPEFSRFFEGFEPDLVCDSFLEAKTGLEQGRMASPLPDFLEDGNFARNFLRLDIPEMERQEFCYYLAWNPRLLRLNPHAVRRRDALIKGLMPVSGAGQKKNAKQVHKQDWRSRKRD